MALSLLLNSIQLSAFLFLKSSQLDIPLIVDIQSRKSVVT